MWRGLKYASLLHGRTLMQQSSAPQIHHLKCTPHFVIPKFNFINLPRFFSSESDSSDLNPNPNSSSTTTTTTTPTTTPEKEDVSSDVEDVSNEELKSRIEKYFEGDEEALPSIFEAILARKLTGKHEDTDDELVEELSFKPLEKVDEEDFESDLDFDDDHETDDDSHVPLVYAEDDVVKKKWDAIVEEGKQVVVKDDDSHLLPKKKEDDDSHVPLVYAKDVVVKRMVQDEYFNMDDKKWDAIVEQGKQVGLASDTKECEEILEDMLYFDKLLPEDVKQKVQAKYDELGEKLERNELEAEEAYEQFKVFEDEIVAEQIKKDEEERLLEPEEVAALPVDNKSDDPPGVGPILRWQSRVYFVPGGDAWHPKNRKVKLSVTVKELGLTKYQFRRMREIVGKRYHSGKDELTITSERYEHREENRKDCLRTLLSIIEEAGKADALVAEARTAYVKQRLKANPAFMARLHAKTKQAPAVVPA